MSIALCVPTRGRPAQAARFLESVRSTQWDKFVTVRFALQDSDPELKAYFDVLPGETLVVLPDGPTTYAWNYLARTSGAEVVGLFGDDCVMETPGWDVMVEHHILGGDRPWALAPADGRGAGMPHYFVTKSWLTLLGYMAPPHFWHFYVDIWTEYLARGAGCLIYDPAIMVRHNTFKVANSGQGFDETYARVRRHTKTSDDLMWAATERHRLADIELLKCQIAAS